MLPVGVMGFRLGLILLLEFKGKIELKKIKSPKKNGHIAGTFVRVSQR